MGVTGESSEFRQTFHDVDLSHTHTHTLGHFHEEETKVDIALDTLKNFFSCNLVIIGNI